MTLMVHHLNSYVSGCLRLKVDTGTGRNTLSLRTYQYMLGSISLKQVLSPEPSTTLTSYSGHRIQGLGSILVGIKKDHQALYTKQKVLCH